MALAMLALFAQLWMVQLSTVHWGQMLSEQALFSDVCSAQTATHSGQTPDITGQPHRGRLAELPGLQRCCSQLYAAQPAHRSGGYSGRCVLPHQNCAQRCPDTTARQLAPPCAGPSGLRLS